MTRPALAFSAVSAFLMLVGLLTAEQQFKRHDLINQEARVTWAR